MRSKRFRTSFWFLRILEGLEPDMGAGRCLSSGVFDCSEIMAWTGALKAPTNLELAHIIKEIGPDRVMMGSDFPWYDVD